MSDILNPTPTPTPAPTTAQALAQVVAQLSAIPAALFRENVGTINAAMALIFANKTILSDRGTPLTAQEIFTRLGAVGGVLVTLALAEAAFLNQEAPGTIPTPPSVTIDPATGFVTVTGG